ncbi:MAG: hypothetical protein IPH57_08720 [Saprospiraceae bacterium]|nr:hypothetical protein [Saprospiraceae bacterium]
MNLYSKVDTNEIDNRLSLIKMIESRFDIILPFYYKQLQLTFEVGQVEENWDSYLDKYLRETSIFDIRYKDNQTVFWYGWLYSLEELELDLEYYLESTTLLNEFKVIRIGDIVAGGGLYLGVGNDNQDFIYKQIWDSDYQPVKLTDNIFQYLNNLKVGGMSKEITIESYVGRKYGMVNNLDFSIKKEILDDILSKSKLETEITEESFILNLENIISYVRNKHIW